MPAATPPRKRRKEARPSELTAAALELFVEKGFAATRLEEIASRAGVSKGTLYLYFDSKEALFRAVIQEGIVPVVAEGEAIAAQHAGSAADLLEQLLNNWWLRIGETDYAGIPKLMVAEARNFPEVAQFYYESVIRRSRALIGAALERGMASGEFRRMEVETCIEVVISPVLMLLIWRFSMGACQSKQVDPRQYLAVHMDLLRRGLQANRV
ncbi:MAG: TetR/AcrR family transcriptional regulator [Candidatus Dechloromonas phosphoritropha]|jgi:AcrR family transcriptional regulator